jgi:hypothetical protein
MDGSTTLVEAKRTIFSSSPGVPPTWEIAKACDVLAKACEDPDKVTLHDMLRCLEFPGLIAEYGARLLYVRTGREGLGWKCAGANTLPFRTDKEDWTAYLKVQGLI